MNEVRGIDISDTHVMEAEAKIKQISYEKENKM